MYIQLRYKDVLLYIYEYTFRQRAEEIELTVVFDTHMDLCRHTLTLSHTHTRAKWTNHTQGIWMHAIKIMINDKSIM